MTGLAFLHEDLKWGQKSLHPTNSGFGRTEYTMQLAFFTIKSGIGLAVDHGSRLIIWVAAYTTNSVIPKAT